MRRTAIVLSCCAMLALPSLALADAALVQTYCEEIPGTNMVKIAFAVVNFSLPSPVCDLHFIAEPQPPLPECEVLSCSHPDGWSCFLNPFGGADWFANTPADCIPVGEDKFGFEIFLTLEPNVADVCCYVVQFTDPTGAVILEQEECFTCKVVDVEYSTWGFIKGQYR